jgi:hypothetical protein
VISRSGEDKLFQDVGEMGIALALYKTLKNVKIIAFGSLSSESRPATGVQTFFKGEMRSTKTKTV